MRRLPPLNALRAFEAAGRHLSFSKAAAELNVTPAAISQQVKLLEEHLGVMLFRRLNRALLLTDDGQICLPALRDGFDRLADAVARIAARHDANVLTVSVTPSLAAKWLVPRLDRFHRRHPDFDIRIDATSALADFSSDGADVAIRYGDGDYPGMRVDCLLTEEVFPVCSPRLTEGPEPLLDIPDLARFPLLHIDWAGREDDWPDWRMWLAAAGYPEIDASRGSRFSRIQGTGQVERPRQPIDGDVSPPQAPRLQFGGQGDAAVGKQCRRKGHGRRALGRGQRSTTARLDRPVPVSIDLRLEGDRCLPRRRRQSDHHIDEHQPIDRQNRRRDGAGAGCRSRSSSGRRRPTARSSSIRSRRRASGRRCRRRGR